MTRISRFNMVGNPPQIHAMTDEMLAAQAQWLPYFKS